MTSEPFCEACGLVLPRKQQPTLYRARCEGCGRLHSIGQLGRDRWLAVPVKPSELEAVP